MKVLLESVDNFYSTYDREQMEYIDRLSKERGIVLNNHGFKTINVSDAFKGFTEFLESYRDHELNKKGTVEHKIVLDKFNNKVDSFLFQESMLLYKDVPKTIKTYLEGVQELTAKVEDIKHTLLENSVKTEDVGLINEFTDIFMEKMNESFNGLMKYTLRSSGYYTDKALMPSTKKSERIEFL